jgi:hypothetical protein
MPVAQGCAPDRETTGRNCCGYTGYDLYGPRPRCALARIPHSQCDEEAHRLCGRDTRETMSKKMGTETLKGKK